MTDKTHNEHELQIDSEAQAQHEDQNNETNAPLDALVSNEDSISNTDMDEDQIRIEIDDALAEKLIQTANAVLEGEHIANPGSIFGQLAKPDLAPPTEIYLLPVKERPFFPGQQLPVLLNKEAWEETYDAIKAGNCKYIGMIYVNSDDHHNAHPDDFSLMGTLVKIHDPKVKDDYIQLIAEGIKRFEIKSLLVWGTFTVW